MTALQTCLFCADQPIQSSHYQQPLLWDSHTWSQYSSALSTPGPGTRQLKHLLMPQSLLKLFKLANPKPAYSASPVPSCGNHSKGSHPSFPLTSSNMPPDQPDVSLCGPYGMACFLLLGRVSITNSLFSGSHLLICWLWHT